MITLHTIERTFNSIIQLQNPVTFFNNKSNLSIVKENIKGLINNQQATNNSN